MKTFKQYINEDFDKKAFSKWKRLNVTYRGMQTLGKSNEVYGSFGKGLYTVPLSNISMAKQYGKVYFVVGAIPQKPVIVQSLNSAEIYRQQLIVDFCKSKKHDRDYDIAFFELHTSMDKEVIKKGFDGLVIKGREMVNYKPSKQVKYFSTEDDLITYYMAL